MSNSKIVPSLKHNILDQGRSKDQELSSIPVTKVKKMIVVFWDLFGAIQKLDPER